MRGSEIDIPLFEMRKWEMGTRYSDTMKIMAFQNGEISFGAALRKSMEEKLGNDWKIEFYSMDDLKVLAVHPNGQSGFRYPKNGRRNFKSYVEELKRSGYAIPAVYKVEWNEKMQSWIGVLQEVAECPQLMKGRRKNAK